MKLKIFLSVLVLGLSGCTPAPTSVAPLARTVNEYGIKISGNIKIRETQYYFSYEGEKGRAVDVSIDKEKVKAQTKDKKEIPITDLIDGEEAVGRFISQIRTEDLQGTPLFYHYSSFGYKIGDLGIIEVSR